ncbi:uncharacterized protein [Anabrus simplex]|uniref:uncharacterized protein n=1 Tax=Anabrus simplex TaxID=316456 RepID=UPI0035A338D2
MDDQYLVQAASPAIANQTGALREMALSWTDSWAKLTTRAGAWPPGHPLPLPLWGTNAPAFHVPSVEQYEELASSVELTVQQLLQAHNYNSVGNLIRFYQEFRASGESSLDHFFQQYSPPITAEHYTCVGLALELLRRLVSLESKFPGISCCMHLVSCEESIEDVENYVCDEPSPSFTEKEHVLVAMKVVIAGRWGILLLDPGYHVARVVTVMADCLYPHTGWFIQSDEPHCRKEYNYILSENCKYIVWSERETRGGLEKTSLAVVYVGNPFLNPVDVTERRNLVYNFRSLLARDTKGHLISGLYFKVDYAEGKTEKPSEFTIFHQAEGATKRLRVAFSQFLTSSWRTSELSNMVKECGQQLGMIPGKLELLLANLAIIMADLDFKQQLLRMNKAIGEISQDN